MVLQTKTDKVLVVINGCIDKTYDNVNNIHDDKIRTLYFNKPLGVDIPRSVGSYFALKEGARSLIFIDGDMCGEILKNIDEIIMDIEYNHIDIALTDCYPENFDSSPMARILLAFRERLNREIGIFDKISCATPSHGPHGLSRKLIRKVGFANIAVPPVALSIAALQGLNIRVSTKLPDSLLGSTIKDEVHAEQMAKTIIGDCIEALSVYRGEERKRGYNGTEFLGYHKNRRFDILNTILD